MTVIQRDRLNSVIWFSWAWPCRTDWAGPFYLTKWKSMSPGSWSVMSRHCDCFGFVLTVAGVVGTPMSEWTFRTAALSYYWAPVQLGLGPIYRNDVLAGS